MVDNKVKEGFNFFKYNRCNVKNYFFRLQSSISLYESTNKKIFFQNVVSIPATRLTKNKFVLAALLMELFVLLSLKIDLTCCRCDSYGQKCLFILLV